MTWGSCIVSKEVIIRGNVSAICALPISRPCAREALIFLLPYIFRFLVGFNANIQRYGWTRRTGFDVQGLPRRSAAVRCHRLQQDVGGAPRPVSAAYRRCGLLPPLQSMRPRLHELFRSLEQERLS